MARLYRFPVDDETGICMGYPDRVPELPEVETIRTDLESAITGERVRTAVFEDDPRYRNISRVVGQVFISFSRRGKYLIARVGPWEMVIHLGMAGRLFVADDVPDSRHVRGNITFYSGRQLVFVDRRRFGVVRVVAPGDYRGMLTLARMGPEPFGLAFSAGQFARQVSSAAAPVKLLLLRQKVVAGLGNIYADEVLHAAGIHPADRQVSEDSARKLHRAIRRILRQAIAHRGTSFSLYRDGLMHEGDFLHHLRVFGRTGLPCRRCGEQIEKTTLGGRGTHFCPKCQPRSRTDRVGA